MPMYVKLDIFRITEKRDGAVYKTKKVGWHWFELGRCPGLNERLTDELVRQNGFPPGEYFYCSTTEMLTDIRCPAGGKYN